VTCSINSIFQKIFFTRANPKHRFRAHMTMHQSNLTICCPCSALFSAIRRHTLSTIISTKYISQKVNKLAVFIASLRYIHECPSPDLGRLFSRENWGFWEVWAPMYPAVLGAVGGATILLYRAGTLPIGEMVTVSLCCFVFSYWHVDHIIFQASQKRSAEVNCQPNMKYKRLPLTKDVEIYGWKQFAQQMMLSRYVSHSWTLWSLVPTFTFFFSIERFPVQKKRKEKESKRLVGSDRGTSQRKDQSSAACAWKSINTKINYWIPHIVNLTPQWICHHVPVMLLNNIPHIVNLTPQWICHHVPVMLLNNVPHNYCFSTKEFVFNERKAL
jgi:hypothetical protein